MGIKGVRCRLGPPGVRSSEEFIPPARALLGCVWLFPSSYLKGRMQTPKCLPTFLCPAPSSFLAAFSYRLETGKGPTRKPRRIQ